MRDGWRAETLGSIATIEMGQSPPGSSYNASGDGLPFLQGSAEFGERYPKAVRWCSEPRKVAQPGDILLSVRAPVGDQNRADRVLAVGRGLAIIRSASPEVLTDYLAVALQEAAPEMRQRSGGTMFESINGRSLASQRVPVPLLAEQRRIVDLIQRTEDAEAVAEVEHTAAVEALNALREDLITRHGARECTLREVLEDIDGGVSPVTEGRVPVDSERAVLKLSAVRPGRFVPAEAKAVAPSVVLPERALVRVGDVLITRSNTPETVGFVCYVDAVRPHTYLSDLTLRLDPIPGLDRRYLAQVLNTGDARKQIMGSATGTSGSMRKISRRTIRDIRVPIPASLMEQVRIADALESASDLVDAARNCVLRLAALRSALLAALLSGDHEIPASYDRFLDGAA